MKAITKTAIALAATALVAGASAYAAQSTSAYPSKPIRLIVPFSPGGSADNLARTLQPALSATLGQSVVIDNRGGASGVIGTELAARAPADGYTILLITTTHTVNPSLIKKLPYDTIRDFSPMSLAVSQANILAVHPSVPANSVKELVALAKSKSAPLTYASGGNGSSPHLSGELFRLVAGIDLTHVPFKGSGPGVTALLGGQVTMMFAGPLAFEQHIKAGKIRALAVAAPKRSSVLRDMPTMAEAGFAGIETGTWYGFIGPTGIPPAIAQTVHEAVVKVMAQPDINARLLAQGVDIVGAGPREFGKIMREEVEKWAKLVKRAGITPG
jgi:tripartite-type tricarboxylate transporter receptor subunit TctC